MTQEPEQYLCRHCGHVIPGEVSGRRCAPSPDFQHRRGERWHPPGDVPVTSSGHLTPYDTGERLQPCLWASRDPEHYGKVDFEDDESATIATVHFERTQAGYRMVVDCDFDLQIIVNGKES